MYGTGYAMGSVGPMYTISNNTNTIREQTICNDPQLSKLDREVGATFERLNKKGKYYKEFVKRQNTWTSET